MMLIDFQLQQQKRFDRIAIRLLQDMPQHFQFDSIADAYHAPWLADFPKTAVLSVSGQDDGAEQFCLRLQFGKQYLQVDCAEQIRAVFCDRFGQIHVQ